MFLNTKSIYIDALFMFKNLIEIPLTKDEKYGLFIKIYFSRRGYGQIGEIYILPHNSKDASFTLDNVFVAYFEGEYIINETQYSWLYE